MTLEFKTLILEDSEVDAELQIQALKKDGIACNARRVDTEADFRKQLAEFLPDLIICDFSLPEFDGLSALKIAQKEHPDTPFIFVSGTIGEQQAVDLLKNGGASDYILKGNPARLSQAVLRAVKEAEYRRQNRVQEHRISRLNRVHKVLSGINTLIVRVQDRQELLDGACRIAAEHGGFGIAWIGQFNPETLDVTPIAWSGIDSESLSKSPNTARADTPLGQGMVGRAIREGRAVFSNDLTREPNVGGERRKEAIRRGYRSGISLPLMVDGQVAGNLSLFTKEIDFFEPDELELLNELAGNISFALQHIGKEEKVVRLSRIRAVMSNINSTIIRVRDRQELFNEACRIVVEHGNLGMAWIGVLDPVTQDVTPVAWAGQSAEELVRVKSSAQNDSPRGKGAVGQAIRERRVVFNNDILAHNFGGPRVATILRVGLPKAQIEPLLKA